MLSWVNRVPPAKQTFTIGLINPNPGMGPIIQGFVKGLEDNGYKAGVNVTFLRCEKKDEIPAALIEMLAAPVDLIFALTTPGAKQAQKAAKGTGVPVVFALQDPVASGIIDNLIHHGANVTGIQMRGSIEKSLGWLRQILPEAKHIFVPICYDTEAAKQSLTDLIKASKQADIKVTIAEVTDKKDMVEKLNSIPDDTDAIYLTHSMLISKNVDQIARVANEKKLPFVGSLDKAEDGALFTFASDLPRVGRQASRLALGVLQGELAPNIPAEIADFYLTINLEAANRAGIKVSNDVLIQADRIIR